MNAATAAPALFALEADAAVYVDPMPGRKGSDRVLEACGCDNGVYTGPSRVHWNNGMGDTTWCFGCNGTGTVSVLVSSVRARARRLANAERDRRAAAAEYAAQAPAREAAEAARVAAAVAAEAARVAAMVQGFVAPVGGKLAKVPATVTMATTFEVRSFSGFGTELKALVVLTTVDGHVLKAMGTSASLYSFKKGDAVLVSATVKAHDNYRDQDQTVLTRTKLVAAAE